MKNMQGTWAVITGASSGIGEEYARQLAAQGLNLFLVARREERLKKLQQDLQLKFKISVEYLARDLKEEASWKEVFNSATTGRKIQVLINNAGIGFYGPFHFSGVEEHLNTVRLNTLSLTALCYYFSAHMLEHQLPSYITNVASIAAYQTVPKFGVYSGSKKFVKDLSDTLHFELRKTNISVTTLSPGGTYTEFMDQAGQVLKQSAHAFMMSAKEVAAQGIQGMWSRKREIIPGFFNKLVAFLSRLIPDGPELCINSFFFEKSVGHVSDKEKETAKLT